jgi:hypothetical protein
MMFSIMNANLSVRIRHLGIIRVNRFNKIVQSATVQKFGTSVTDFLIYKANIYACNILRNTVTCLLLHISVEPRHLHVKKTLKSVFFSNICALRTLVYSKNNHGSSQPCSRIYRVSEWWVTRTKNIHVRTCYS